MALAEAEFGGDEEVPVLEPPARCVAEVTDEVRFTGGSLVRAARRELSA